MSSYLVVLSPGAVARAGIFLLWMLGLWATPLSAQMPLGQPETLVFRPGIDVGPGNQTIVGILPIGPWSFASLNFHSVTDYDAGLYEYADNGTPFIASVGGGLDHPITLERLDGSPFSLVGFDAAEGFLDDLLAAQEGFVSAGKIEVEATLATGFTVTLEFDLDGLRDGPDGVNDFETLAMSDTLQNVTSVTFTGVAGNRRDAGFALDNVVVAAVVPEPDSLAVAASAVAILFFGASIQARGKERRRVALVARLPGEDCGPTRLQ